MRLRTEYGGFARCGVITQLISSHSGCPSGNGSGSVTSRPAPAITPFLSASVRASVSTKGPRPTLTITACWHLFQSISVDHVVSFRSEWCQHHEVVRSWPNLINLVEGEDFIGAVDRLSRTVYRNNLRAKALQHRNQLLANSTCTDNCHGLVFKKEGRIRFGLITYRPGLSQCHALV